MLKTVKHKLKYCLSHDTNMTLYDQLKNSGCANIQNTLLKENVSVNILGKSIKNGIICNVILIEKSNLLI